MECFRCNGRDFDVLRPSLFGLAVLQCYHCKQQFFVEDKKELKPVELLGKFDDIEKEYIMTSCAICQSRRYIAIDCTNLDMVSCGLCEGVTEPVGKKLSWDEFLNRSSSIDDDAPVS